MKVSLSWLKQYVPVEMDAKDLAESLTMAGLEVESIYDHYDYLSSVVVGRIVDITCHPNAEKLHLCKVDAGNKMLSVVCGASNIKKGMVVPLALPGTVLPNGTILKKTVIRGEASEGMLCSENELGIGTDSNGIMALADTLPSGQCLSKALKLSDPVLDIDLTPNRPDCLSIVGIAREAAAIRKTRLNYPDIILPDAEGDIADLTSVTIEAPEFCHRYTVRVLENVTIAPSPPWLRNRLLSIGVRPINNIVDVTNFVMMETGQPLHAFDFDRLAEHRIVVRTATDGEMFKTLDQKERKLADDMLLICDGRKPIAIAGVMGGYDSEIKSDTRRILLESACFAPSNIRKAAKKLGLATEASHRFERGVDPEGTIKAINRAAQLIGDLAEAILIGGIIDQNPVKAVKKTIPLNVGQTNSRLGLHLDIAKMAQLLSSVGFRTNNETDETLNVTVPSFRVDVTREVDLSEEVARLSGYDTIPTTYPLIPAERRGSSILFDLRNKIRQLMTGFGFSETINYSFISKHSCDRMRLPADDPKRNQIIILNPISEDQAVMRSSLIPGLMETAHRNISQQVKHLKIFETGKIFISTGKDHLPKETEIIAGLWTGSKHPSCWYSKEIDCDFYDLKGVVEALLRGFGITDTRFTRMKDALCTYTRPGYTAQILFGQRPVGLIGEIHPSVLTNYDLKQTVYIFELDTAALSDSIPSAKIAVPIPKFPSVSRDITLIVSNTVEAQHIPEHIKVMNEALISEIRIVDMYAGEPIPVGKKSLTLRITYRSPSETLEDQTVNEVHKAISDKLLHVFDAMLPT
ncbi:MAG: phenylalanine--tRNA ligase subunit beta [Desulfobacterales bacterium]|nr:phenylalanine--tRNA ligase subunit beta [Desulfobacterales bacterium]MDD4071465.1 phenylalanine--tRNA ligase subunit beta [Desulfobacterales bacterium]MDD4393203.1 phenylalanine--tRNA ligase subunit beta [Desulfobacterales bacterium]